jgi:transcription-repair coupling factor (superfamily II helicase)
MRSPITETPDQLVTIDEVKADMMKPVPMDRLICGDVGFGKTEIAVRAAFKAVQDGNAGGRPGAHHAAGDSAPEDLQ